LPEDAQRANNKLSKLFEIKSNLPPLLNLVRPLTPANVSVGEYLFFAASTRDPDGSIQMVEWDIPGGQPSSGSETLVGPVFFDQEGVFQAECTVTAIRV